VKRWLVSFQTKALKSLRGKPNLCAGSEITGLNFLKAVVLGFLEKPDASLNEMAQSFLDIGVEVTAQGIDERINAFSVAFLRAIFAQVLELFKNKCPAFGCLQQFSAINLVDSSTNLPDNMADEYPGCGRVPASGFENPIGLRLFMAI
jgi:hypothetical protein